MVKKDEMKKEIMSFLRNNSRSSITDLSKKLGVSVKKVHYEYEQIKKNKVKKLIPVLNFEAFGFKRLLVLFHDASEGLRITSTNNIFHINNSTRLDLGLMVEYVFFYDEEQKDLLDYLKQKNVLFDYFEVQEILKQESFIP